LCDGGSLLHPQERSPEVLSLTPLPSTVSSVTVRFVTPTELKIGHAAGRGAKQEITPIVWAAPSGSVEPEFRGRGRHSVSIPEFAVLAARVRDRISTLGALYGDGPLAIDFGAFGQRAAAVRMTRCDLSHVDLHRRSSRTGQVHPIGGFVGEVQYEGDVTEFMPYLRAACWTGVGRQTAWGKGQIEIA
jgi:hypothetical protein